MDGWTIGLVAGGALLLGLVVLFGVVVKAAATTARTAQAILMALEEVKASTAPLSDLRQFDPDGTVASGNGAGAVNPGAGTEERQGKEG